MAGTISAKAGVKSPAVALQKPMHSPDLQAKQKALVPRAPAEATGVKCSIYLCKNLYIPLTSKLERQEIMLLFFFLSLSFFFCGGEQNSPSSPKGACVLLLCDIMMSHDI